MPSAVDAVEVARQVEQSVVVYLTRDRVLYARGEDASAWINGQVTADVRSLEAGRGVYALIATVKGRVVSDLWLSATADDAIRLALPETGESAARERLESHIIMEDVELAPASDERVLTVQGPKAEALRPALGELPCYSSDRLGRGGFDVVCPAARCPELLAALETAARAVGGGLSDDAGWEGAHVRLARPRMGIDFGPDTYPQEAGLKERALSFQKGCYLGQEVIYMLENRGQLARRLVQLEGAELRPGAAVLDAGGGKVGEITSVVAGDPAPRLGLGYVKRAHAEPERVLQVEGAPARVRAVVGLTEQSCPIAAG